MAVRVKDITKLDDLELLCSLFICMDGDLPRMEAWIAQAKHPTLLAKCQLYYKEINERWVDVQKRVLERTAVRALNEVVRDRRSRQRVAAAQALIAVANGDTSTAEGKEMLQQLMAGGKKPRATRK